MLRFLLLADAMTARATRPRLATVATLDLRDFRRIRGRTPMRFRVHDVQNEQTLVYGVRVAASADAVDQESHVADAPDARSQTPHRRPERTYVVLACSRHWGRGGECDLVRHCILVRPPRG